ncbi:hypothetical protein [Dyella mobilis]|uniref:DUF3077 domain-containing protein n=1 Tax=Dyella mobilis TaxID=1849582 RepID=A0ABS2KGA1_9GAMM|nr:hypothetical protein [Dyella mobilis]MBM7129398.1 hypothetical protein [Dyella mobilis]GLQ98337.1 hypothetical protein GCM10007863_27570 [Dyella mobilis]
MNMRPENIAVIPAEADQARKFFQFAGTYNVSSDTSAEAMASDASCFLESVEAMLNKLILGFSSDVPLEDQSMIFGIRHFVEMANNLCQEIRADLERVRRNTQSAK